jgi:regulator of nucleoside diphosphate kinase
MLASVFDADRSSAMSNEQIFRLTTKDYTILEVMLDRSIGRDETLVPILRRKLSGAIVTFREDIPADVVTLSSRVTHRVNGGPPETRILAHEEMRGLSVLTITNPRGLALLGLAEGEQMTFEAADGTHETVLVEAVVYQPESARRDRERLAEEPRINEKAPARPSLRVVHSSAEAPLRETARPVFAVDPGGFDDPGPSAA